MGVIAIEGMSFYAYHGYYKEESFLGGKYIVDVYLYTDFQVAAKLDELKKTINYESIYKEIKNIMDKSSKLIEHVLQRIFDRLYELFDLSGLKVRVSKLNPPLGGQVNHVFVEQEKQFK